MPLSVISYKTFANTSRFSKVVLQSKLGSHSCRTQPSQKHVSVLFFIKCWKHCPDKPASRKIFPWSFFIFHLCFGNPILLRLIENEAHKCWRWLIGYFFKLDALIIWMWMSGTARTESETAINNGSSEEANRLNEHPVQLYDHTLHRHSALTTSQQVIKRCFFGGGEGGAVSSVRAAAGGRLLTCSLTPLIVQQKVCEDPERSGAWSDAVWRSATLRIPKKSGRKLQSASDKQRKARNLERWTALVQAHMQVLTGLQAGLKVVEAAIGVKCFLLAISK